MGLYDRDYMRRARSDEEERTGVPAWLRSSAGRSGAPSRRLWAVLVSLGLAIANWHWHLFVFHLHRGH